MRNLAVLKEFQHCDLTFLSNCKYTSLDIDTGYIFAASDHSVCVFSSESGEELSKASLKEEGFLEGNDVITDIYYVLDQFSLCISLSNGDLFLWDHNNPTSPVFEIARSVGKKIVCMSWSPDSDVFVIITGDNELLLLTRSMEVVAEVSLMVNNFGEGELVTLGWGKKETQFHGSEGKQAAVRREEGVGEKDGGGVAVVEAPVVTWRGDGLFFVVNYCNAPNGSRTFRVFSREAKPFSTYTGACPLMHPTAYKSKGNLIALVARDKGRSDESEGHWRVAFHEKNALSHGGFDLPPCVQAVLSLHWNSDSSVLTVVSRVEQSFQVQLWTTGNYHWYLKQVFPLRHPPTSLIWDSIDPLKLHLITLDNSSSDEKATHTYKCYFFNFVTTTPSDLTLHNQAIVAVLDADHVLWTPFSKVVVPPPMSASSIPLPCLVHSMCFGHKSFLNDLLVVGVDSSLHWFGCPDAAAGLDACAFKITTAAPYLKGTARLSSTPPSFNHVTWSDQNTIIASLPLSSSSSSSSSSTAEVHRHSWVVVLDVDWSSGLVVERTRLRVPVAGLALQTCAYEAALETMVWQTDDGTCYRLDTGTAVLKGPKRGSGDGAGDNGGSMMTCSYDDLPVWEDAGVPFKFKFPYVHTAILQHHSKILLIGLTHHYKLLVGAFEVAQGCTSFLLQSHFLLYTTHSHLLNCLPLHQLTSLDPTKESSTAETARRVEKGSRLVASAGTWVAMQLPRGNLEVIHPRCLLVHGVKELLDSKDFKGAFDLCRRHRINTNLLCDHDMTSFLDNLTHFVRQLDNSQNINIFLVDLTDEDFTKTMYAGHYAHRYNNNNNNDDNNNNNNNKNNNTISDNNTNTNITFKEKVTTISKLMCDVMTQLDQNRFFLSILMTHLKRKDLEEALLKVKLLKDAHKPEKDLVDQSITPPTALLVTPTTTSPSVAPPTSTSVAPPTTSPVIAAPSTDEALHFLTYVVDVDSLFDVAMGTYDFELATMVAARSNKDPREYVSWMDELRALDNEHERKHLIDLKLKRYHKALEHLHRCGVGSFEACLALIKQHHLFQQGLLLYEVESPEFKRVCAAYAEHLTSSGRHGDAGVMFMKAGCHGEAMQEFVQACDWRMAMTCHHMTPQPPIRLTQLARQLADKLKDQRRGAEAALLYEHYAQDYEEAIVTLLQGHLWQDALHTIQKHKRHDMMHTSFTPALLEAHQAMVDLMTTSKEAFTKHLNRLLEVRKKKMMEASMALEDAYADDDKRSDIFSDASSQASGTSFESQGSRRSNSSGRSGKSRGGRKKWSLRHNSSTEEFALVEALYNLVQQVQEWKPEVGSLARTLVLFNHSSKAAAISDLMSECVSVIAPSIPLIWNHSQVTAGNVDNANTKYMYGPQSTSDSISKRMAAGKDNAAVSMSPEAEAVLKKVPSFLVEDESWKCGLIS